MQTDVDTTGHHIVLRIMGCSGDASAHLEDLDHHLLVVGDVDGLKHLAVLPSAQLTHQLVVFLVAIATDTETV